MISKPSLPRKQPGQSGDLLTSRPRADQRRDYYAWLEIDIDDIDHYALVSRPICWTTFKDFAKQPKVDLPQPNAPASASTSSVLGR